MSRVLITGANKGVGLELARRCAARGDEVLACCRRPDEASALRALAGSRLQIHRLDVGDPASIAALKQEIGDAPLDVLINNAGTRGPAREAQTAVSIDWEGWARAFAVNAMGPTCMHQTFLANLKAARNPKSITISSQMGAIDLNWPLMYAYSSSKAALNKVFRMLSADPANEGIAFRLLHPGHVKTDMGGPRATITVEESVGGILAVIADTNLENSGTFVNWNGEPHPW